MGRALTTAERLSVGWKISHEITELFQRAINMYQSSHHKNTSRNALCNSACTPLSSVPTLKCSSPTHSPPTAPSYLLNSERKVLTPLVRSSGDRRHPPEWGQQHVEPALLGAAPGDTLPGAAMPSPPPYSLLTPHLSPQEHQTPTPTPKSRTWRKTEVAHWSSVSPQV